MSKNKNEYAQIKEYSVYLVHSGLSLASIRDVYSDYGPVGPMKIVFDKEGNPTNRTILLLEKPTYDKLVENGFTERADKEKPVITKYKLRNFNFPGQYKTFDLYIPISDPLRDKEVLIRKAIISKMETLAYWNIIPSNTWNINIPLINKRSGKIKQGCYIKFVDSVSAEDIAMVKAIVEGSSWDRTELDEHQEFRCYWAREKKPRKDSEIPTTIA